MTANWQDPTMGSAYHTLYGGSEKHDAVPELFEDGWMAAMAYLNTANDRNTAFEEMNDILDNNGDDQNDPRYLEAFKHWSKLAIVSDGS